MNVILIIPKNSSTLHIAIQDARPNCGTITMWNEDIKIIVLQKFFKYPGDDQLTLIMRTLIKYLNE